MKSASPATLARARFRDMHILLAIVIGISCLHGLGLYFYTTGFFLTRYQVSNYTHCQQPIDSTQGCYGSTLPKKFSRAIVLVIDALRFDFTLTFAQTQSPDDPPYRNKLPIVFKTLRSSPSSSFLFKFIADPPTTTMQRLKGLTTGGLPTFMDASENFASDSITEDNWVLQAKRSNKNITFMGDDTWVSLFPGMFSKSFPYPSFNVKDLHTVDNGVLSHLIPEITTKRDWDVLIGHFLGVDHVGHRHGMDHPEMALKLGQMDQMLTEVIEAMEEDTVLFLLGDHGMTYDGNHGGASDSEVEAGLFVYAKRPFGLSAEFTVKHPVDTHEFPRISQVDLVPTISLLLGLPIPFGNLGVVVPELFYGNYRHLLRASNDAEVLEKALNLNIAQMDSYLRQYSATTRQFPRNKIESLAKQLDSLHELSSFDQIALLRSYHQQAMEMCRQLWTTFNESSMTIGIGFVGLSLLVQFGLVLRPPFGLDRPLLWLTLLIVALRAASLWSNSYIESERSVSYFLLAGLTVGLLWKRFADFSSPWSLFSAQALYNRDLQGGLVLLILLRVLASVSLGGQHDNYFTMVCTTHSSPVAWVLIVFQVFLPILATSRHTMNKTRTPLWWCTGIANVALLGYRVAHLFGLLDSAWTFRILLPNISYIASILGFWLSHWRLSYLFPLLSLVGGPSSSLAFVLLRVVLALFSRLNDTTTHQPSDLAISSVGYMLLASLVFYSTGHQPQFSSLQFAAPFTGFDEFEHIRGVLIVTINTWSSFILVAALLFKQATSNGWTRVGWYHLWISFLLFNTMAFTFLQRRHLMVWRVFAPKYIFDGATIIVTDLLLCLAATVQTLIDF